MLVRSELTGEDLRTIVSFIADRALSVRASARFEMTLHGRQGVDLLTEVMRGPDTALARAAVETLRYLGPKALPVVVPLLADDDPVTRGRAEAVVRGTPLEAIPPVLEDTRIVARDLAESVLLGAPALPQDVRDYLGELEHSNDGDTRERARRILDTVRP